MADYDASDIIALCGLEAVRRRPGMYIGNTDDGSAQHNMLDEVLANAVDECLSGYARRVQVDLDGDRATVTDDGRGIPVDIDPRSGRSLLERIFTTLHTGPTRFGHSRHVHLTAGLQGVGLAPVCALSDDLVVDVWRDGRHWRMELERGQPRTELLDLGPTGRRGTRVSLRPDPTLLAPHPWRRDRVADRLRRIAGLVQGVTTALGEERFHYPGGTADYVADLAHGPGLLDPPLRGCSRYFDVEVDVAVQWIDREAHDVRAFVSLYPVRDGVLHDGFFTGLRRALERLCPERLRGVHTPAFREAIERGLVAVVCAGLYDPRFAGPTRDRLDHPDAARAVARVVEDALVDRLRPRPALLARLLARLPG